jgi:hypothetical protein
MAGIAGAGDSKSIGRVGMNVPIYFEAITTVAIVLCSDAWQAIRCSPALVLICLDPGTLMSPGIAAWRNRDRVKKGVVMLLTNIVPEHVVASMAKGGPFPVIFFAILLGFGLQCFGCRGTGLAAKSRDSWEWDSADPAQRAVVSGMVDYVARTGALFVNSGRSREAFAEGLSRIERHERALRSRLLNGRAGRPGLRRIDGVTVHGDRNDLSMRELIVGIVRISPLHGHSPADTGHFPMPRKRCP